MFIAIDGAAQERTIGKEFHTSPHQEHGTQTRASRPHSERFLGCDVDGPRRYCSETISMAVVEIKY